MQQRIVEKTMSDGTLTLSIGFADNCCLVPQPAIRMSNDTLYLSIENSSQYFCTCNCCFELELKITGILDTGFVLMLYGRELKKTSKYANLPEYYHFDKKTPVNQSDQNNQKIGLWRTYYKHSKKVYNEEYYITDQSGYYEAWSRTFDKKGNLIWVGIRKSAHGPHLSFDAQQYARLLETSQQ
jgi:hypothetical protein